MTGAPPDTALAATLQLVTDTIVASLGFGVAVLNLVQGDEVVAAAVTGPDEVRELLLGARQRRADWDRLLQASQPCGGLLFLDHRLVDPDEHHEILMWVPDLPVSDDPDAWHPDDALFAVLRDVDGAPLGMLSVDLPHDGRRPDEHTRRALEAFGVTASLAIQHAALAARVRHEHHQFVAVFDASPVAVALRGPDGRYTQVNPAFCRFLGRDRRELLGRDSQEFTHPRDRAASAELAAAVRRTPPGAPLPAPVVKRYLRPDGTVVWGRLHLAPLGDPDRPGLLVAQVEDVTERRRAEQLLRRQAQYDALTELPNRAELLRRLRRALDDDRALGLVTAVFFGDLDRLKWLNDTHGHAAGDAYLVEASRRISRAVGPRDTVGRLGGDEFVVVARGVRTPTEAIGLAGRLIAAVRAPWCWQGRSITPSVSVGVALTSGGEATAEELLSQADTAMYQAKVDERGSWHVYDPAVRACATPHYALRGDLPAALAEGQFRLHDQPVVRLPDRRRVGAEALLRWQHPRLGLLQPAQFLDVVLDSEFESPVTDWVLQQACEDLATTGRRVSVNISSVQVARRDLPDVVASALRRSGLPAGRLVLELTEDRLLSRPDGAERLGRLRALGVQLALNDFGSGWAGLTYLQRFEALTAIKLDGGFAQGLGRDRISEHIVRSTVELARSAGLGLVVEGVETEAQAAFLTDVGVRHAQGYLFGRPDALPEPRRGAPGTVPPAGSLPEDPCREVPAARSLPCDQGAVDGRSGADPDCRPSGPERPGRGSRASSGAGERGSRTTKCAPGPSCTPIRPP